MAQQHVRYDGGARREERQEVKGETEESVVYIRDRDPGGGSQEEEKEATRDQVVQRELIIHRDILRAAAVCLTLLCVLLAVRTTDMALDYHSDNNQTNYNDVIAERDHLYAKYNRLILERDQLQSEVNQLKRENAVKSCPGGWKKFGRSCYYTSTEKKIWEQSREQCVQTGADLLVVNSKEEQEFIRGLVHGSGGESWIGLKKTEAKWTWVDATPLTTQYWGSGQPNDDEDWHCAAYGHREGEWENRSCFYQRAWICEK